MTLAATNTPAPRANWFNRAEAWLDDKGKGAWIAAMVLGFVFIWPVGLALLIYMIWSKRMFSKSCSHKRHAMTGDQHYARRHGFRSSGNTAFDAYKAETLRRLMDEQEAFEDFLERLRAAKDKSEFDQFMDERADATRNKALTGSDDNGEDAETLEDPTKDEK